MFPVTVVPRSSTDSVIDQILAAGQCLDEHAASEGRPRVMLFADIVAQLRPEEYSEPA